MSPIDQVLDLEKLLAPVPGQDPGGRDLRYEPIYDKIRIARRTAEEGQTNTRRSEEDKRIGLEVATAASIEQTRRQIESLTTAALGDSKDLQLGVWLLEVATHLYGFAGTAAGLQLIRELMERFWDHTLFPPLDDEDEPLALRVGVLEWISQKLPGLLSAVPFTGGSPGYGLLHHESTKKTGEELKDLIDAGWPTAEQFDAAMTAASLEHLETVAAEIGACLEQTNLLEKFTDSRFVVRHQRAGAGERVEMLLGFGNVRRTFETCQGLVNHALEPKRAVQGTGDVAAPEATAEQTAATGVSDTSAAPARPVRRLPAGPIASPDDAVAQARAVSEYFAAANAGDPTAYLVSRAIAFGSLFACGDVAEALPLASPPTAVRQRLRTLSAEGPSDDLLREAEGFLRQRSKQAWLDLQRYVITSMEQMGYHGAAAASRAQLKTLLDTLPALIDAEFEDGTPVANQETRRWLRESGIVEVAGPVAVTTTAVASIPEVRPAPGGSEPPASTFVDEALNLIRAKKTSEALALLQQHVSSAASGRDRFLRRLDLAEVCLDAGNAPLAYPILDDLSAIIERANLEEWEDKALVVRAWSALVRCCRQLDGNPEVQARGKEVFTRLCRLDISIALSLDRDSPASSSRWHRR